MNNLLATRRFIAVQRITRRLLRHSFPCFFFVLVLVLLVSSFFSESSAERRKNCCANNKSLMDFILGNEETSSAISVLAEEVLQGLSKHRCTTNGFSRYKLFHRFLPRLSHIIQSFSITAYLERTAFYFRLSVKYREVAVQ